MSGRPWLPAISEVWSLPVFITLFLLISLYQAMGSPGTCATPPLLCLCSSCAGRFPVPASCPLRLASPPQRALPTKLPLVCLARGMAFFCNPTLPVSGNDFSVYELPDCDFSLALILVKCILLFWKTTDCNTATYTVRHEIYD